MPTSRPLPLLCPERLRRPPPSFAWLDHRLRSDAFLPRLSPAELSLYLFLVLAADAQGLSCWRLDRLERFVPFDVPQLVRARDGLQRADLLAFRPWHPREFNGSYQVLALPPPPPPRADPARGPATVGQVLAELGFGER